MTEANVAAPGVLPSNVGLDGVIGTYRLEIDTIQSACQSDQRCCKTDGVRKHYFSTAAFAKTGSGLQ
jgi:hypothetical protein